MKRQGIILCITITAIIGSMFCTGCTGKDTEPAQTAASVPAATEEGNRIITEGMLSPQIIPVSYTHLDVYKRQHKMSRGSILKAIRQSARMAFCIPALFPFIQRNNFFRSI